MTRGEFLPAGLLLMALVAIASTSGIAVTAGAVVLLVGYVAAVRFVLPLTSQPAQSASSASLQDEIAPPTSLSQSPAAPKNLDWVRWTIHDDGASRGGPPR
ncbi:MAG TPA: hypothetical protein VF190_01255 [Rhodothermales bacterium]